jgi:hypothetical protein
VRVWQTIIGAGTICFVTLAMSGNARVSAGNTSKEVTFTRDVAPIFFSNCAACHRPGEIAPMSLLSYKDARPWAKAIREKVLDRSMPPWHADRAYGAFKNDRSLSKGDIDTIVAWVEGGAREGDPKDLPPPPHFTSGWQIGQPDLVLSMPFKFDVPAQGVVDYKYFMVPTNFTEDRWIQAAEVRPGTPSVVHHVIVFITPPEAQAARGGDVAREGRLDSLVGVAPGEQPMILPDGVAKMIKAGSRLVFQMHYTPNGVAESDQTSVGIIFSKKPVTKAISGGAAMNRSFVIPPGNSSFEVASSFTFKADSHITSLMPHMHLRGKDFQYRLVYPDGESKIILLVPQYDFNWQTRYEFKEPVPAPKGSKLQCMAHFDNSTANRFNPDPTKEVRWGPQTWEEMMIGFVGFTLDHQEAQQETARAAR